MNLKAYLSEISKNWAIVGVLVFIPKAPLCAHQSCRCSAQQKHIQKCFAANVYSTERIEFSTDMQYCLISAAPAIFIWNNSELYGNDCAKDCAVTDEPRQWRKLLQASGATGISVLCMVHQEVRDLLCENFTIWIDWMADMATLFRPERAQPMPDWVISERQISQSLI